MAKVLLEVLLAALWIFGVCMLGLLGLFRVWPLMIWTLGMIIVSRLCKNRLSY